MKLFLSSIRLPNQEEQTKLFGSKERIQVTIMPNAWDKYPEERRKTEITNTLSEFEKLGYRTSLLDLVTSSDHQRRGSLSSSDFLWVMGGNTFYLNYRLRKSGFDALVKEALLNGLVYGGTSAGAVITGPTLHGVENADDQKTPQRLYGMVWAW